METTKGNAISGKESLLRNCAWGVLFGLLGFVVNWFKLELFHGIDFIFGSIFVMLAAGRFGIIPGAIAGAIAASCTFLHWNHPWSIIVFTCEAVFAGWLFHRRGFDLVFADILYWVVPGIPLSWLLHYFLAHIVPDQALFIVCKQAVNGIFNTLLASVILLFIKTGALSRGRFEEGAPPLRSILFNVILALILTPALFIMINGVRDYISAEELSIVRRVHFTADSVRDLFGEKIQEQGRDIETLAPGGLGEKMRDFARRRGVELTLLDGRKAIILSTIDSRKTGQQFNPVRGRVADTAVKGVKFVSPPMVKGESRLKVYMKSAYLKDIQLNSGTGWTILVESPVAPYYQVVRKEAFKRFIEMFLLVALASIASYFLSRALSRPLANVAELTTALPQKIIENREIKWPGAAFQEMHILMVNIGEMAESLGTYLSGLKEANDTLELRVAERTRELEESEQRARDMAEEVQCVNEELEAMVRERTAELDFSNRELEGFCYAISHELRAPIARLQGFCDALREDSMATGDSSTPFYTERINVASHQLRQVIDAILHLSRLARAEIEMSEVDLSSLAKKIASELVLAESARKLQITVQSGIIVLGDYQLLAICLENLMGNAVKYSSKKDPAIIEFGRMSVAGEEALFVRDNGAGFDMAYLEKLFKPFGRLHTEAEFPGTGIGLATVQRIVERHGGRIWAEGREGEGATMFFTLNTPGKD